MQELIQTALKDLYASDLHHAYNIAEQYYSIDNTNFTDNTFKTLELQAVLYKIGYIEGKREERQRRKQK